MPPNTSLIYSRRNRSLLEGLLPVYNPDIDEVDAMPRKNKYNKFYFRKILSTYNAINERDYQEVLQKNIELQHCKVYMNRNQLEGYKKLIFVHNYRKVSSCFERSFAVNVREKNRLGIACRFLKTIAIENQISIHCLLEYLTRWYFQLNHKKLGLIFFGSTNSGKSLLADLLTS